MIRIAHVMLVRGVPLLIALLVGCGDAKHGDSFHVPGVIFSEKQTLESGFEFQQNSAWLPTLTQVEELEAELPQYLAKSNHPDAGAMIAQLPKYRRQYLGYIDEGHRRIYVNAFCQGANASDESWRTRFVLVQDGGSCYFQAIYDVDSKRFIRLRVNGVA
jgi:hypothetical protein